MPIILNAVRVWGAITAMVPIPTSGPTFMQHNYRGQLESISAIMHVSAKE